MVAECVSVCIVVVVVALALVVVGEGVSALEVVVVGSKLVSVLESKRASTGASHFGQIRLC